MFMMHWSIGRRDRSFTIMNNNKMILNKHIFIVDKIKAAD